MSSCCNPETWRLPFCKLDTASLLSLCTSGSVPHVLGPAPSSFGPPHQHLTLVGPANPTDIAVIQYAETYMVITMPKMFNEFLEISPDFVHGSATTSKYGVLMNWGCT
jgi:hypothetical protein